MNTTPNPSETPEALSSSPRTSQAVYHVLASATLDRRQLNVSMGVFEDLEDAIVEKARLDASDGKEGVAKHFRLYGFTDHCVIIETLAFHRAAK